MPSDDNKQIAFALRKVFGGAQPKVRRYTHNTQPLSIDVVISAKQPSESLSSLGTIGLSDHVMLHESGAEFQLRLELVAMCAGDPVVFGELLAAVCFSIIQSKRIAGPGDAFRDYIREFFPNCTVPHAYLTTPFPWQEGELSLEPLALPSKRVHWAMLIAISENELEYMERHGGEAFDSLLDEHSPDIADLHRPSVI